MVSNKLIKRKTRFRAWSKRSSKMLGSLPIEQLVLFPRITNNNIDDLELMQFTEVYDAKKEPIYEGDIVVYNSCVVGVVMFKGSSFIIDPFEALSMVVYLGARGVSMNTKIIGNIFENRDLVKYEDPEKMEKFYGIR